MFSRSDIVVSTKRAHEILSEEGNEVRIAVSTGDLPSLVRALREGISGILMQGMRNAMLVWYVHSFWKNFNLTENPYDYLTGETGLSKLTQSRYFKVWDMFETGKVPVQAENALKSMPISNVIPVGQLVAQGFEITDFQWERIAHAADGGEIVDIVREIKGVEVEEKPTIYRLKRDGTLQVIRGDSIINLGFINIAGDAAHAAAVDRFLEKIKASIE